MLSTAAMSFMKNLADIYKQTGVNSFAYHDYMDFPDYSVIIEELMNAGYLLWKNNHEDVLGNIVINFDALKKDN